MKLYAVHDVFSKQLSAAMTYKRACIARRYIRDMSRIGMLQAIIATPPFKVKEVK